MVPDWRNGAPQFDAHLRQDSATAHQFAPTTGSRKRKAYMPRNSGCDEVVSDSHEQLYSKKRATGTKVARSAPKRTLEASGIPEHAPVSHVGAPLLQLAQSTDSPPSSPAATSSKAVSVSPRTLDAHVQRCVSGSSTAAAAQVAVPLQAGGLTVESLATTRSRRVIKRREKFDPHMFELSGDLEDAEESPSDNSSETLSRRSCYRKNEPEAGALVRVPTSDSVAASGGAPSPRAWLSALVSGMPKASGGRASELSSGTSDEQRMFQEFRKRTCTAYTGVVVHCQNMKLEARVNMVSYFPQRERKISGGQIYIAYMTNPHQAAVVHDITASIMTAPGIPIYHNHHCRPSTNREVALERLNYLDTLDVNMHRGHSRNNDKDQLLEKKARMDAENRRQVMLSPEALKRELHCWVSHDSRWLTFKSWIEDVLFESKLANMCLKPKTIDSSYLKPEEQELLNHWAPEFSMANPPVFTHMYDTLVMDRIVDSSGNLCGYKLRAKRYRRRKPEVRNGAVKWFDDKSFRCDLEDAPTDEDQHRVDIAWGVVCRWLSHYDPALQGPPPNYDAVDANYYVTWGHFADWVNTLLEHMPSEIKAMQETTCPVPERSTSTRRSARNGDGQAMKERIRRLQAVHDKFRGVVTEGESMPSTWSQAKPEHRRAFENFFSGWKPLPPSMSQLQRRAPGRSAGDCGYRSSRRAANARNDTAPQTRSSASRSHSLRESCPSAPTPPATSAFINFTAAAAPTGTTSTHTATVDPHATPTSPVLTPETVRATVDCTANVTAATHKAASVSTALRLASLSQSVELPLLPRPLLPPGSHPSHPAPPHTMQRTQSTNLPLPATGLGKTVEQYPGLTVASLAGISAKARTGSSTPDHDVDLSQQTLAAGVVASMSGIRDVAGLHAWATMHGLSSAVPAMLEGKGASTGAALHSTTLPDSVVPTVTVQDRQSTAGAGRFGASAPLQAEMSDMHLHLQAQRLQAHLQSPQVRASIHASVAQQAQQQSQEYATQMQTQNGTLNDALAALNMPQNGPFSSQPQQYSHPSSTGPETSAPDSMLPGPTAPLLSGPTQLVPQPLLLPPSAFLTALEHPTKPTTVDSLFQGAPAMPPLLTGCLSEPTNSSINSARSCMTGSSGACHTAAFAASRSVKSNSTTSASGAAATTETAVHHPTLSSLLSNPLFAMPTAAQAARGAAALGSNPGMQAPTPTAFARQFSSGK